VENRWLSVEEIGEYLGVKKETIYQFIKDRDMPAHKVGKSWKFQTEEIDNWIKSGLAGDK
jgi:excisionase family DNA binding protein